MTTDVGSSRRKVIEKNIDLVVNNWKLEQFLVREVTTQVDVDFVVQNGQELLRHLPDYAEDDDDGLINP